MWSCVIKANGECTGVLQKSHPLLRHVSGQGANGGAWLQISKRRKKNKGENHSILAHTLLCCHSVLTEDFKSPPPGSGLKALGRKIKTSPPPPQSLCPPGPRSPHLLLWLNSGVIQVAHQDWQRQEAGWDLAPWRGSRNDAEGALPCSLAP